MYSYNPFDTIPGDVFERTTFLSVVNNNLKGDVIFIFVTGTDFLRFDFEFPDFCKPSLERFLIDCVYNYMNTRGYSFKVNFDFANYKPNTQDIRLTFTGNSGTLRTELNHAFNIIDRTPIYNSYHIILCGLVINMEFTVKKKSTIYSIIKRFAQANEKFSQLRKENKGEKENGI